MMIKVLIYGYQESSSLSKSKGEGVRKTWDVGHLASHRTGGELYRKPQDGNIYIQWDNWEKRGNGEERETTTTETR